MSLDNDGDGDGDDDDGDDGDGDDAVDGVYGDDDNGVGDGGYDNESVLSEFNGLGQKSLEVLIMVKRIRMTISIFWGGDQTTVSPLCLTNCRWLKIQWLNF